MTHDQADKVAEHLALQLATMVKLPQADGSLSTPPNAANFKLDLGSVKTALLVALHGAGVSVHPGDDLPDDLPGG